MRVLILIALMACAAAAPSGFLAPVVVPAVAYSAIVPTISPGDIEAAAIDAQVEAQDQAIAAVDKAREISDLAVENVNEKVVSTDDQVKEKVVEQFWSEEEKKWQALDALKTAEAQIDGSVALNADALSKSAIKPYVALEPTVALASAPVITPGIVAPVLKAAEETKEEKPEPVVKSTESDNSVAVEAIAEATEKTAELKSQNANLVASVVSAPLINQFKYPIVAPIIPPVLKYSAVVPYSVQTIGLTPQTILTPGLAPIGYNTPVFNVW